MEPYPSGPRSSSARNTLLLSAMLSWLAIGFLACTDHGSENPSGVPARKSIGGGGSLFDPAAFSAQLRPLMPAVDTTDSTFRKRGPQDLRTGMRYAYGRVDGAPLWLSGEGVTEAARQLMTELDSLRWDGLDPERYGLSALRQRFEALKAGGASLSACIAFDTACTRSYLQASRDLLMGTLRPRSADSLWFHQNDTVWTAPALLAASALKGETAAPPLGGWRSSYPTYAVLLSEYRHYKLLAADAAYRSLQTDGADSSLSALIRKSLPWLDLPPDDSLPAAKRLLYRYQEYWGLVPTGRADSATRSLLARPADSVALLVAANLERLRWLPQHPENRYVLVNIPLMELFFRDGGAETFHMRVVVGKPSRQTPCLGANMANVVFNPPWGVPPTILKKDVLPGISRSGGGYLARKGLKAYDRKGKIIDAGSINARNYRNYTFRQAPGARNALGEVKFNLPNPWDIYLHDTPHREDFPRRNRALSSGCVRVQKPREFAEFLLREIEQKEKFTPGNIDSIIRTRRTRYEGLQDKIPVHIVYLTAFEDGSGGHARFLTDIYRRDRKLLALLRKQSATAGGTNN